MNMMDAADARFNTYLMSWFLLEWHAVARRRRMHRQRSLWIAMRRNKQMMDNALLGWYHTTCLHKRLATITQSITSKYTRGTRVRAFKSWSRTTAHGTGLRTAAKHIMCRRRRNMLFLTFKRWFIMSRKQKVSIQVPTTVCT